MPKLAPGAAWGLRAVDGSIVVPCYTPTSFAYRIVRQPVPTAAQPLQLTGTIIIDLNWSSDSENGVFVQRDTTNPPAIPKYTATYPGNATLVEDVRPIIVMFSTTGSLERIYRSVYTPPNVSDPAIWNWTSSKPSGPVHLLIGQRDAVPANSTMDAVAQEANNWRDLESLWVSIHPQTGQITTTENVEVTDPVLQANPIATPPSIPVGGITAVRKYAIQAQSMGGR